MKQFLTLIAALLVCGAVESAQKVAFSQREVRDPRQLETHLEANATDAETRIAVLETTIGTNAATAAVTVGSLTVNDGIAVNTNATVGGTLAVTGVATFTAESVHNLGIDADYITTDAGAGIDTKTEGTLMVGAATANKVEIGDTAISVEVQGPLTAKEDIISDEIDAETATALLIGKATATSVTIGASDAGVSVPGTLAVTGVATLTAAPVLVATNTPGAITLTMTNAPTAADAGKEAPVYLNVTIGGATYVIPAWPIAE